MTRCSDMGQRNCIRCNDINMITGGRNTRYEWAEPGSGFAGTSQRRFHRYGPDALARPNWVKRAGNFPRLRG